MRRLLAIVLSLGMLGILAAPAAAAPPARNGLLQDIEVTGQTALGTFEGLLDVTGVALNNGVLTVTGVLNGDVTDAAGNLVTEITNLPFTTTASLTGGNSPARCDILFLDLGPINLDVLGLVVDLSAVQLDIFAVPGAGNLLGNLLCAVAGLLDGGLGGVTGALQQLIALINDLL